MTRADNELLRVASERVRLHDANARAFSIAGEVLAFAAFVTLVVLLIVSMRYAPVVAACLP